MPRGVYPRKRKLKELPKGFKVKKEKRIFLIAGAAPKSVVNHPSHYQSGNGLEAIDVIEAFKLDFHLGNSVKYILRSGKKENEVQDLKKAVWYLSRYLKNVHNLELSVSKGSVTAK